MEIMKSLSRKRKQELLELISDNYHNKFTARELMTEVLNAGFEPDEILFILHECDKNSTFKFKPEPQKTKPNQRIELMDVAEISGMKMSGFFRLVGFRFMNGEKHVVLTGYSDPDGAIFIVSPKEFPYDIERMFQQTQSV